EQHITPKTIPLNGESQAVQYVLEIRHNGDHHGKEDVQGQTYQPEIQVLIEKLCRAEPIGPDFLPHRGHGIEQDSQQSQAANFQYFNKCFHSRSEFGLKYSFNSPIRCSI